LELGIVANDEVDDVQVREGRSQIVEDLLVVDLLEAVLVDWVLIIKKSVHLKQDILRQCRNLTNCVKKFTEHRKRPTHLDFLLASSLVLGTIVLKQRTILSKVDERVEVFAFNFVLEVDALDLQVAEDRYDFGDGDLLRRLKDVKQTGNVLLNVERHIERLEGHIFDAPNVGHVLVCDLLKLFDFREEIVHVLDTIVKHDLFVIDYTKMGEAQCTYRRGCTCWHCCCFRPSLRHHRLKRCSNHLRRERAIPWA